MDYIRSITDMLPLAVADKVSGLAPRDRESAMELNLVQGFPPYVNAQGRLVRCTGGVIDKRDLDGTLLRFCDYSLSQQEQNLKNGYVTLAGGHRAAVAGSFVNGCLREVCGISVRIARECKGISERLVSGDGPLLVCGEPMSGKTTFLRDYLCRVSRRRKTVVVDERGELGALYKGKPSFSFGEGAFFLDNCPRREGFEIALRCFAPELLACDEIYSDEDIRLLHRASGAGVAVCATHHSSKADEFLKSAFGEEIKRNRLFDGFVMLRRDGGAFSAEYHAL